MDDREVVAAIAAGSPTGTAAAYDKYAAILYEYCQWSLDRTGGAVEALQDTFVVASTTIGNLGDAAKLRPWLYALARQECQRRLRTAGVTNSGQHNAGLMAGAEGLPDVRGDLHPDELLSLIRGILAELQPPEREVIELSLRHDLHNADLAEVLGVSWSRAQALTVRARTMLEKALGALLIVRTGQKACPDLSTLLADWDGRLTEQARDLIAWHVEQCQSCADRKLGGLRPAALSGLMLLDPLPSELRERMLKLCFSSAPGAVAYRRRVIRRAESVPLVRVSSTISLVRWARIRANPGAATALVVVVVWIVAAASIIVLTLAGSASRPCPGASAERQPPVGPPGRRRCHAGGEPVRDRHPVGLR